MTLLFSNAVQAQDVPAYMGSQTCVECHTDAAEAWSGSHHAFAWTLPSPDTVVADFDGTTFEHDGMTARFRLDGDEYAVEVTEKDGVTTDYRVHSVAGIEPLQQYLLETEPGRLQSFDVVWDTEIGGWFHLYPDQDLPPNDGLHWTGPYKNWNARCAECHATGYETNYDAQSRTYASTQAEIGVGCEACHGPGEAHLRWADGEDFTETFAGLDTYGFTQSFATTEATIQQCAVCHSLRETHDDASPVPGTPYHDAYTLSVLRPGMYHPDGQIFGEVYVYGSFLQSRMYAEGVGCMDCHDAHSGELVADGNALCAQCHSPVGNPDFPTLTLANYDTPEHHFHPQDSEGAQCRACHMPEQVYMGNDWRADHSFRVPRPDVASAVGAPDACTACHTDQDQAWAAAEIAARFPEGRHTTPHFGLVLSEGFSDPVFASADLADLAADESASGLVRATALWILENANSPSTAARLAPLLEDEDPLVRSAAAGMQLNASPEDRVMRLIDLLDDPARSVRIATARTLLDIPVTDLPAEAVEDRNRALGEWRHALSGRMDAPETHIQLGGVALTMRAFPQAIGAFREVVELDPQRSEAWVMLIRLAAATEGIAAAREVVNEAIAVLPDDPTIRAFERDLGQN